MLSSAGAEVQVYSRAPYYQVLNTAMVQWESKTMLYPCLGSYNPR